MPTKSEYKTWVLEGEAIYDNGKRVVVVPDGFMTDFASIPWAFRWWQTGSVGPQRIGSYFHDYMYSGTDEYSRRESDLAFRKVMELVGSGPRRFAQRWMMWAALRVGGILAYRSGQKKFKEDPNYRILN